VAPWCIFTAAGSRVEATPLDALIGRVHQVTPRLAGSEHRHFFFVRETFNDLRSFAAQTAFTDALVG